MFKFHGATNLLVANYPYAICFIMVIVGMFVMLIEKNLIKKVIGLNIMQTGIILFFIVIAKIEGGVPPIYTEGKVEVMSNPLPHVLMLTAIVVGIATLAVAFALIYRIHKNYKTIDEEKLITIINKESE